MPKYHAIASPILERLTLLVLLLFLIVAPFPQAAQASFTTYSDRTSFEAAVINEVTDDFDSFPLGTNSAATMKSLSAASIG